MFFEKNFAMFIESKNAIIPEIIVIVIIRSICLGIGIYSLTDLSNVVFGGNIIFDNNKDIRNE